MHLVGPAGPRCAVAVIDSLIGMAARRGALILLILAMPGIPAFASENVPADPWQIIHVAREFGSAEVTRDSMKDPQIRGEIDGMRYRVNFYGCRLGRDCDTILLEARFMRKEWLENPPEGDVFARWNREKLIGRAWWDETGRAVLDFPVIIGDGLSKPVLRRVIQHWKTALTAYVDYLGLR